MLCCLGKGGEPREGGSRRRREWDKRGHKSRWSRNVGLANWDRPLRPDGISFATETDGMNRRQQLL